MSAGGLLVESDGVTLLIDAGVGAVRREVAVGGVDCGALLDVLAATGRSPGDIDVVAFTHLHFDHAGGAFVDGRKTFPNARYVLSAAEWAPHADGDHRGDEHSPSHVLRDLARTPLELIDDGAEILPGVRAIVTGGHTPGHTAYVITSRTGRRLIAFGDAFQIPAHLAHPEWFSTADADHSGVPPRGAASSTSSTRPTRSDSASTSVTRRSAGSPEWTRGRRCPPLSSAPRHGNSRPGMTRP